MEIETKRKRSPNAPKRFNDFGETERLCTGCNQYLLLDRFRVDKHGWHRGHCKRCQLAANRANPRRKFEKMKKDASKRNRSFFLTYDQWQLLRAEPSCACCGKELLETSNSSHPAQRTIDRVDNHIDYYFVNCRTICRLCNELKNANTEETLLMILDYIKRNKSNQQINTPNQAHAS